MMRVIPTALSTTLRLLVRSEITDAASMSELRQFVKDRQLAIKTAGPGRTREKVLFDIRAVLAPETQPTEPVEPGGITEEINPSQQQQQEQDQTTSNEQSTFSFYLEESALGGEPHPSKLVETTTLASVRGPPMTAQLFGGGAPPTGLSNVQLEAIALATQAHDDESALHAPGSRRGLLCGDGTGCGKGRTIAGCVLHNYGAGRQRSVWVTASAGLARDARRDLDDIEGGSAVPLKLQASFCLEYIQPTTANRLRQTGHCSP